MNLRRSLLTTAGALTLVALPSVAMAYDAPGYGTTVTDSTPASGQAFTLTTDGPNSVAGQQLTLTITSNPASITNDQIVVAGTKSLAKTADASGNASWTVTLNAAGTYTMRVTDAGGALLGDEALTVAAAPGSALSDTGFNAMELGLGAGALILAGGAAVVVARRRQAATA